MATESNGSVILQGLNDPQRQAVQHGDGPLLVVAGAGTGKTRTLVHRVAHLIERGVPPSRILLLTFTRRAAGEMLRRAEALLRQLGTPAAPRGGGLSRSLWGGTFHAVVARLLRAYGTAVGLDPEFTILDRSDAEDLLDVVRTELDLVRTDKRFPRKAACLAIYSQCVNSQQSLEVVLAAHYPWCREYAEPLKQLFRSYGERKELAAILDYDDLLLFWRGLLADPAAGAQVCGRFDHVLVDEYQDTNRVQADILRRLRPAGRGLTVVGDDAQAIYSFRAATVQNILDFATEFAGTTIVRLEQNYRSTSPILAATNDVMAQARRRFVKNLWTAREGGDRPMLVACHDENEQADFVVTTILQQRETAVPLRQQAVLFRAGHHSIVLEGELTRRNVPYVKYGGLKFLEAAHIKDLLGFLRLAENARDVMAGLRVLQLLPGIGPKWARQLMERSLQSGGRCDAWDDAPVPAAARAVWPDLRELLRRLTGDAVPLAAQIQLVRRFYDPILKERYEHAEARLRDLEQLEQFAARYTDRRLLLTEITLDPPESSGDFAGPPLLDDDYLILSTIHSAKGLEWDTVFVIHAADGNIPSDLATGREEDIEEERRLFYVALTRARNRLYVCWPLRYYHAARGPSTDRHSYSQLTRFLPGSVASHFARHVAAEPTTPEAEPGRESVPATRRIRTEIQALWS